MTTNRWAEVERLYHAALARAPEARGVFLREACAGDAALRNAVEALLAQPTSGALLDGPAVTRAADLVGPADVSMLTGRRLGVYQVHERLGVGGMGEVYRARDTRLGRDVAIKILPRDVRDDPDRLARFEREARLLAALNHPHIGAIYGVEEGDGIPALVLELVDGPTLADRIARGRLPVAEALTIARQIADALDAAHEKGIVHRDLKPANVKVRPDGTVKVLDFGLAKLQPGGGDEPSEALTVGETQAGVIVGTVAYMSPEQARGQAIDKRTDIWAFGCVLYEMLAGRSPFHRASITDTLAAIVDREPDWEVLPEVTPPAVRTLLKRCLDKEPRKRLRDAGDIRLELDNPQADSAETVAHVRGRARRGLAPAWAAAAGVLVLAGGAYGVLRESGVPENPLTNARFTKLTDFEGSENDAAISRDGRFVAFRSDRDGPVDTWVTQVGSGRFVNLTNGNRASVLIRNMGFTPDGSEIWLSSIIGGDRLRTIPLLGGAPRPFLPEHAINVAWAPAGAELVFHLYDAGDPMFVAESSGANARQIFTLGPGGHNHFPVWSRDGQWIYFASGIWEAREMDIWRIRPSGGSPERLTQHGADVRYLTPLDDRTLLYVSPDENGAGPWLWALDTDRRVTRRITSGLEVYSSIDASGDGRRLVASVSNPTATLWSVPLLDRVTTEEDVTRFDVPSVRAYAPRFGGRSLFYLSSRGGGDGLWRADDGEAVEVWRGSDGALLEPAAVTADGQQVALVLRRQGRRTLNVLSSDGGDVRPLASGIDVVGAASWSPDGTWIAAGGLDGDGPGLFKIPADGGDPQRVTKGAASNPVWSPDGSVIVYTGPVVGPFGPLLMVRPDGTPVDGPAIQVRVGSERYRFVPGRHELAYLPTMSQTDPEHLWLLDLRTQKARQLTSFVGRLMRTFDITPDGTQIVFDRLSDNSDLVVIDLAP